MFAGENKLRIGEGDGGKFLLIAEAGVVAADAVEGGGLALDGGTGQFFGLLLILFEVRAVGDFPVRHTKLLSVSAKSGCASGVRMW